LTHTSVGITQGGLLHHFRSKEDLLLQVLARCEENDTELFFSHAFVSAAECYAALVRLAEYNSRRLGRTRMFNVLAAEAGDPGHPAHAYFTQRYVDFTQRYVDLVAHMSDPLRHAVESGELKPDTDIVAVCQETAAVMDGLQVQWVLDPKGFDTVGCLRGYADRLLRSITVEGNSLAPDA
jgi:AcrR family transcriptional regulator